MGAWIIATLHLAHPTHPPDIIQPVIVASLRIVHIPLSFVAVYLIADYFPLSSNRIVVLKSRWLHRMALDGDLLEHGIHGNSLEGSRRLSFKITRDDRY